MKHIILAVALLGSNVFGAVVTTYSSRATFEGALSSFNVWDFTGTEGNPVITLNSLGTDILAVSTLGGDAAGTIHENALCGSTAGAVDCFPPLVFNFLQTANSFGFDNLDFNGFEEAVVVVAFANGDPLQEFVFDLGGAPAFTPTFFGIISDQSLASVVVYSRDPGTSDIGARANIVDNVTVGASEVPEPGTLFGLLTGLGAILLRRSSRLSS